MRARSFLWAIVAVLLVAAALRFIAFGEVPPGLYHDEAYHGLDALDILRGRLLLYFPTNNGREPLFIYLVALAVGLLGRSPFALRLPAFFAGVLTVAATGAMGRALSSRRVGLLAAAVLAVTLWHVHLSRVGFRAVLLPLLIALTAWQGAWGIRTGRSRHWLVAGFFYGLSFYTYTAARFTPVAVGAYSVYAVIVHPTIRNPRLAAGNRLWHGIGLAALAALVTVAPLAAHTVRFPEVVLGRPGQVSVFNSKVHGGDLWGTLGAHLLRTLGMFFVRGDRIWRHNVPWRPVFDPLLGAALILGIVVAVRRLRRDPGAGFALVWTAVMTLPTLLAEDAPHFLRAVGVLPVVALLPALGLDWLANRLGTPRFLKHLPVNREECYAKARAPSAVRRGRGTLVGRVRLPCWRSVMVSLLLLFSLGLTVVHYFRDYAHDPMAGYWFERGALTLAGRINGFLRTGWDGERMVRGDPGTRRVHLDQGLWEEWPQVQFLVAARDLMRLGLEGGRPDGPVAVFVWPHGEWQRAWALLPTPAEVTVEEGAPSQGDRDPEPHTTYLAFFATPPDSAIPGLARFSGGVELLGAMVTPVSERAPSLVGEGLRVRLRWRATEPLAEDYTVFLHYLRDGERIAQADARPAAGYYPTTVWRPGDVVTDDHFVADVSTLLPGRDALHFGLWEPGTGALLYLLDDAGNPAGDWIEVPVDG